ncbi:MAG: FtsX-like permease family protein [Bacilli bacterium]
MKKAILKDSIVEIKKTYKRFISLLLMAFLGVGFFAGIRSASPDMKLTIDKYFDKKNVYDVEIMSTFGLNDEDTKELLKVKGVKKVYGTVSTDVIIKAGDEEVVTKIHGMDKAVNKLTVVKGRLPKNINECVVEPKFLTFNNKKIGDYIDIQNSNKSISFKESKLKIVGTVESPLYISRDRGISSLGSGKVNFFAYVHSDNIVSNYYTNIYLTLDDASKMITGSKEYTKYVNDITKKINKVKVKMEKTRYTQMLETKDSNRITSNQAPEKLINPVKWYVLNRTSNYGHNAFIQDSDSIANIGKVFPIVFFIIATLIGLTSMTRMVEEERMQIGTLKALGYSGFNIAFKYVLYSILATVIGGIIGMSIGFYLLPTIIWYMYEAMYTLPNFVLQYNLYYGMLGLGITILCIVGATIYAINKELKSTPATLMRPIAPKLGKRVLLENIPFIWKRLNFSNKVTIRNIFRYKKRFLMTVIGIFGCTALMLTGFGLKDSISTILNRQYQRIFKYDIMVTMKNGVNEEELNTFKTLLESKKEINKVVPVNMQSAIAQKGKNKENVQLIASDDPKSFKSVILLEQEKNKKELSLKDNDVYITSKLADLLGVKKGSEVYLTDSKNKKIKFYVTDIVSNHTYHYVYMNKKTYEKFNQEYFNNVLLIKNKNDINENTLAKEIMKDSLTSSVSLTSTIIKSMDDTLKSLNYVVMVLIAASGILAFVVLYNLSNVNISERIRELATIKVLGFYDKEVYLYVTRETVILTIIGIVLGYVGGYYLNFYVLATCEINVLRFNRDILLSSYVYATLLTILFTLIVNFITYFSLKKIDMIESLKSVE